VQTLQIRCRFEYQMSAKLIPLLATSSDMRHTNRSKNLDAYDNKQILGN
jgi:hypothetical protein